MKKLNLKLGGIKEMLGREQMKKVVGGYDTGYGPGDCEDSCGGILPACGYHQECTTTTCKTKSGTSISVKFCDHY